MSSKPFVDAANARETDRICDRFEHVWRTGTNPCIEDFVVGRSGPQRSALLRQLVLLEWSLRQDNGEQPDVDEYTERFPNDESLVRDVLHNPETTDSGTILEQPGTVIGNYKLLQQIGEGGFGVVYMAEQQRPVRRKVALKIIKPGMDSKQVISRFEAERQALAMMDHPHIAKVLDGGATKEGRPYFVMELVKGVRISTYCDDNHLTIPERLPLFVNICEAVQHAHQKGIIHRDLKPSNVLVTLHDGRPVVKVIDFGVAKAMHMELTERTLFTAYGQMIGTPQYMSPEQAEMSGLDIDTRADVYALGVMLYELLAGSTPLEAGTLRRAGYEAMQRLIRESVPPKPSTRLSSVGDRLTHIANHRRTAPDRLRKEVRGDLDWIVMRCLEKDRARRYETANSLAMDVKRYLNREPIIAHPPSQLYRLQKLLLQHRSLFTTAAVVAVILLVASIVSIQQAMRATTAEREQNRLREEAVESAKNEADLRKNAEAAEARMRRLAYAAEMNIAFTAVEENNLSRALELLDRQRPKPGEEDLRGFAWRHLWQLCQSDELASFKSKAGAVEFSPDGRVLVASGGGYTEIRDGNTYQLIQKLEYASNGVSSISFSPDSNQLATAHWKGIVIWDGSTWKKNRTLSPGGSACTFSADGRYFCAATSEGYQVWDATNWGDPIGVAKGNSTHADLTRNVLAFSQNGKYLVTSNYDSELDDDWFQVWRLPELSPIGGFLPPGTASVCSAAFLQDDKRLVTGGIDGSVLLWDVSSGELIRMVGNHDAYIEDIEVSADGKKFITASADRTVRIWDAESYQQIKVLRHLQGVRSVDWSPDGQRIASGSGGEMLKVWDASDDDADDEFVVDGISMAGFSKDSRRFVVSSQDGATITNLSTMQTSHLPMAFRRELAPFQYRMSTMSASGEEPIVVAGTDDGRVEIWDFSQRVLVAQWQAHDGPTDFVSISPDERFIATGSRTGEVVVWEVVQDYATHRVVRRFTKLGELMHIEFSPDSSKLVASFGTMDKVALVWHLLEQRDPVTLRGHQHAVSSSAFSPDGSLIATAGWDGMAGIWDVTSGRLIARLEGHLTGVGRAAFSPDGTTIATIGGNRLRLWNAATFQELASFTFEAVVNLEFSHDGTTLAVLFPKDNQWRIRLLRAPSWEQIQAVEAERS